MGYYILKVYRGYMLEVISAYTKDISYKFV